MGKRKRYTDEFRASAVLMLEAAGYPDRRGALRLVAQKLSVPDRTLSRWYNRENNPAPDKVVNKKRRDLVTDLTELLYKSIERALQESDEATYRELSTGIGILVDKIQLLSGQPTERTEANVTISDKERQQRLVAIFDEIEHSRPTA